MSDHTPVRSRPPHPVRSIGSADATGTARPTTDGPPGLVGREEDLAELDRLLAPDGQGLVTLLGPGGVGKTTVARAAAERARERGDHVEFVELSGVSDAALLPYLLGTVERAAREVPRALVVLDNLEHLLPGAVPFLRDLLANDRVTVLVTSRLSTRLPAEYLHELAPLALPRGARAADVLASPAVRLLLDRTERRAPGRVAALTATPAALRRTAELCARLDGLPLALELAAACLRTLDVAALSRRLDEQRGLPGTGLVDLPERQRSLHATARWSYDLLTDEERVWFRHLGVFRGHFTLDDAHDLGERLRLPTGAEGALEALVDASLVAFDPTREGSEYLLLDTLRDFAERELATLDEQRYAHEALDELLTSGADHHAARFTRAQKPAMAFFRRREDDIRDLLRRGILNGADARRGAELLARIALFWVYVRRGADHLRWFEAYEPVMHDLAPTLRAKLAFEWGRMAQMGLELDTAEERLQEALDVVPEDAVRLRMNIHVCRGVVAVFREDHDLAERHHEESLRLAGLLDEPPTVVRQRANLCVTRMAAGRFDRARDELYALVDDFRGIGDVANLGTVSEHASRVAMRLGELDEAARFLGVAREVTAQITPDAVNEALELLTAEFRLRRGETGAVGAALSEFLWGENERVSVGWASALLSVVAAREGRFHDAARLRGHAEAVTRGRNRNEFRHADDLLDEAWRPVVDALGEEEALAGRERGAALAWRDLVPPPNRDNPAIHPEVAALD
ncbi:ATP-binding protein [Deinococcus pimensis]|uniref:ATP-binding protein n=1 Tax=Deinococcus pimensis TaxID=309888 RepID=UPI000487C25E|nr:hypothetical protein [Deinococcus pimensis]